MAVFLSWGVGKNWGSRVRSPSRFFGGWLVGAVVEGLSFLFYQAGMGTADRQVSLTILV
jgi:hypothetical protein